MKQIKLVFALVIGLVALNSQAQAVGKMIKKEVTSITFNKTTHDFGTINEGDIVETVFEYTNTGKAPLVVTNIKASCGCTVPSNWSKEAIQPGDKGSFTIKFNTKGKPNYQNKKVTVLCNNEKGVAYVNIKAKVTPDPAQQAIRAERLAKRKAQIAKDKEAKKSLKKGSKATDAKTLKK